MKRRVCLFLAVLALAWAMLRAQAPPNPPATTTPATNPGAVSAPPPAPPPIYPDPGRPLPQRIADLVSRMTLQEKVEQLDMTSPGVPRLGVAAFNWWSEGIRGVSRAGRSTMFPHAIGLAATWDPELVRRVAAAVSDEARVKHREAPAARYHGLAYWAPAADLARDPRWGRVMETYGEDPWLAGRMTVAYIRGLQGDDPRYLKVAACVKHFAGHGQETGRHETIFTISPRSLREYHLPSFRDGVVEAKAALCMAAYSGLNGFPCIANKWLITDLLRQEWGFDGAVASDWEAPRYLKPKYNLADTEEKTFSMALAAGTDVFFQQGSASTNLLNAVRGGLLAEAQVDRALTHALGVRFRLGMFDPPDRVPWTKIPDSVVGSKEHVALSREAGRASIVLLKNAKVPGRADPSPLLPLDRRRLDSIAVIGPYGDQLQYGTYESEVPAEPAVTLFRGLVGRAGDRMVVRNVPWFDIDEVMKRPKDPKKADPKKIEEARLGQKARLDAAIKLAAQSDVAIVGLGLGKKNEFEGKDRIDLALPKEQQEFIEKVCEANPATIVVLINGGPLAISWIQEHAPAILETWYPGEQAGNALADVLFGDCNPAGRLPVTFYASLDQVAPLGDYEVSHGQTYLWFPGKPLYPFGYGLSYTRFEYANLRLDRDKASANDTLTVSVEVRNTGERDGDEVVQVYARRVESSVPMPLKQLCAFRRVRIPAGQTRTVSLPVRVADLRHWDEEHHRFVVESVPCEIQVGASSADIRARAPFRIQ